MLIYILKFSACLFLFLGFYKLFLERESFHTLKRFYLLSALALSLCIPFITFTDYVEGVTVENTYAPESSEIPFQEALVETTWRDYIPQILWSIYSIGFIIFSLRFAKHLRQLYVRIKINPKLKDRKFTNVLLSQSVNPHTFFNYIFFNKVKFENNLIPKEVVLHEQTHAKQLHALDILIVELLQIIFWFHPLLYLIKKDVKLNHEFLADQSVIKEFSEPKTYQQLLLAFSSSASEHQLANAINYSSIKKRLTVMKTQTTTSRTYIKSFLLLPLLAVLIFSFSSEKIEYTYPETIATNSNPPIELYLDTQGTLFYKKQKITIEELATIQPLEDDVNVSIETSLETDEAITKTVSASIVTYLREQGLKGFSVCVNAEAETNKIQATPKQLAKYNALAKHYNKQPEATRVVKLKDLKQLETIYKVMSTEQKQHAQPFPKCPPTPDQKGATKAQIKEYNGIAKKYNGRSKNNMTVYMSDVKRLKYIYSLMSISQRKDAEPFPDFPEPPPVPEAPEASETIPPPPPPISPLDHIIDMAKKNAIFYLEGKQISSDKAIETLKKNKRLNIETKNSNTKQPKVYISKAPIVIEKKKATQKTGFISVKGKKLYYTNIDNKITYYNRYGVATDKQGNELDPNKQVNANNVLPNSKISKVYYDDKVVSEFKNDDSNIPPPPPPVDFSMLELANKGAIFYYEGKEISGKKAIALTDDGKNLNILIRGIDSKKPIVKISKKPIRI